MKLKIEIEGIEYEIEKLPNGKFSKPVIAKKYNGFKYSVAPLKQTAETIMVFQKPYKTGSCLHDTLALEAGDDTITCGALDIEGNRVGTEGVEKGAYGRNRKQTNTFVLPNKTDMQEFSEGRYPAQTFCDSETAAALDRQSGIRTSGAKKSTDKVNRPLDENGNYQSPNGVYGKFKPQNVDIPKSEGGCSKILQKCDYDEADFDLFLYCPKVDKSERNKGLKREAQDNNHPTLKPISLLKNVLKLFKTPNAQTVLDCFMGSGSTGVACKELGIDFIGTELNPDYFAIAQKRIEKATINIQTSLL